MNRKERRRMSKNLGIMQYQQKLTRAQKFNLIHENVVAGKLREREVTEEVRQDINKQLEEKETEVVYNMAEDIAKRRGIPVIDALEEAQKLYEKNQK